MNKMSEALLKYRPLQIEAAVESTGILTGDVAGLAAAIDIHESTPDKLATSVFPQSVLVIDHRLAELKLQEIVVLWIAKLSKIIEREEKLLENIKLAIRVLSIDCLLTGDVKTWDMLQLADTGARLEKHFEDTEGMKFQFNDKHIYWECGETTYSIDGQGYPVDSEGNRLKGYFV